MENIELVETILRYYYHRQGKTIRPQSMIVYSNKILRIYKLLNISNITKNIFYNFNFVKNYLENEYSNLNSRIVYLNSCLVWMQAITTNKKVVKKYREYLYDLTNENKKTQRDKMTKRLSLSQDDIQILQTNYENNISKINFEKINMKDKYLIQDYLIFLFYSGLFIPPPRNDIFKILVLESADALKISNNFNYICLKKQCIIFKDYKAVGAHGTLYVSIPPKFYEIILKYKDIVSTDNFLFKNIKTAKLFNKNTFGKKIKRCFNNKATINDLRHHYLTCKYSKLKAIMVELFEDTRCMGSSSKTALTHYIHATLKDIESIP